MTNLRLSPSRVSDYRNCPQLYKYRAIDQLPEAISLDAERGTLVHSILQELFDVPQGVRTEEFANSLIERLWDEQAVAKPELADLVSSQKEWFDRVASLLSNYFTIEEPNSFEPTERELHVEMNLTEDIYLHGYVDRLDIAPSGEVRIVDYKTGKAPKPNWEAKSLFQLQIYALVYWRTSGRIPSLLQLLYLGDGKIVRSVPTEEQLERTEQILLDIAKEILEAANLNSWKPKPSKLCDWCSFKNICPAFNS